MALEVSTRGWPVYNGIRNLKAEGYQIAWTPEMRDELQRCANDVVYFLSNYVKIVHPDRGTVNFEPYEFQKDFIQLMNDERFVIGKLARQCGKSTVMLGYILHYILFNTTKQVAILANTHQNAKKLMRQLKDMLQDVPMWLQQGVMKWDTQEIILENKSRVIARATAPDAIRGETINLVLLDEFAFVEPNMADDFYTSVFPTISAGNTTKLFIISTPKGMNHFHKIWVDAEKSENGEEGGNGFRTFSRDYTCVPGRGEAYAKMMLEKLGEVKFNQEVLCQFVGSSYTLIRGDKLSAMTWVKPVDKKTNLSIYEFCQTNHRYVITVDPAGGKLGDYTVISVFDVTSIPYKHVAMWRANDNEANTMLVPSTIYSIATYYNNAFVLIETNFGNEIALSLFYDHEYENLLYTTKKKFEKQKLAMVFGQNKEIGVKMSASVKRAGCANLKQMIEQDKLVSNDWHCYSEFHRFVANSTGSYAAENDDDHDDVVMSLVLFAWAAQQPVFKQLTETDVRADFHQQNFNEETLPFGYTFTGRPEDLGYHWKDDQGKAVKYQKDDIFGWAVIKDDSKR